MSDQKLSDTDRLNKLSQAEKLICEVEFSYPPQSFERRSLYKVRCDTFSYTSVIEAIKGQLLRNIYNDKKAKGEISE